MEAVAKETGKRRGRPPGKPAAKKVSPKAPRIAAPRENQLLTPEELAERLRVDKQTAYALLRNQDVRGIRVRRQWRITEQALAEYLAKGSGNPEAVAA